MKILHISENIYGGGAENVFYRTWASIKQTEHVDMRHYFAFKAHPAVDVVPDLDFNPAGKGNPLTTSSVYSAYNQRVLEKYLKKLNPDIIHLQLVGNLSPSVLKAVYRFKRQNDRVKVIQTAHTFEHLCSHHAAFDYRKNRRCLDCMNDRYKARIFYRFCSRKGVLHSLAKGGTSLIGDYYFNRRLVDVFITPSKFLASLLSKRYPGETRVEVVRNPVLPVKVPAVERTNTITYFGRLSEEKDLALLLGVIPWVRRQVNMRIRIIGDGPDKEKLRNLAADEGISDICEFIPFVSQSELFPLISDARIFVLASKLFETFSLVLYESVMAGLLPVVPAHGPLKEGVEWMKCGLLYRSGDGADLGRKIVEGLREYGNYIPRLQAAKKKIEEELSARKYTERLYDIYRTLGTNKD